MQVQGRDYLIVTQQDGVIQGFDRKGNSLPGFPVQVGEHISTPLRIEAGMDALGTTLVALSDEGSLVHFNLAGKILNRQSLFRPSASTRFNICPNQLGNDWIISVAGAGYVRILDKDGQLLFDKEYESRTDKIETQYFSLEDNRQIIAITHKISSKTYLYDLRGKALAEPFSSNQAVRIQATPDKRRLIVYRSHGKALGRMEVNIQ
ncbi:MAG: hypothetical protein HC880_09685 [Bacteroidia bacterium]|nr:hypothetical protein [Bacteroidia bacterium]